VQCLRHPCLSNLSKLEHQAQLRNAVIANAITIHGTIINLIKLHEKLDEKRQEKRSRSPMRHRDIIMDYMA
jgi:hypothetical protein